MSQLSRLTLPFGALALILWSCSGDDPAPADGTDAGADHAADAPGAACSTYAATVCAKAASCGAEIGRIVSPYGDEATCRARTALECEARSSAAHTGLTAAKMLACAQQIEDATCDAFFNDELPACRFGAGTGATGSPCFYPEQCQSGYCAARLPGQECGKCEEALPEGAECSPDPDENPIRCAPGLECYTGKCEPVTPGGNGASCGPMEPCNRTHFCDRGTCRPVKPEGASCEELLGECDVMRGLFCDPTTKKCTRVPTAAAGEHCYPIGDPGGAVCRDGASCFIERGFLCVAPNGDGQPCGDDIGYCMAPALCIQGKCRLPGELSCAGGSVDAGVDPLPDSGTGSFIPQIKPDSGWVVATCPAGEISGGFEARYANFLVPKVSSATLTASLSIPPSFTLPLTVTPDTSGDVAPDSAKSVDHGISATSPDICAHCGETVELHVVFETDEGVTLPMTIGASVACALVAP